MFLTSCSVYGILLLQIYCRSKVKNLKFTVGLTLTETFACLHYNKIIDDVFKVNTLCDAQNCEILSAPHIYLDEFPLTKRTSAEAIITGRTSPTLYRHHKRFRLTINFLMV